jgi:uncharacterized membrane protein
MIPPPRHLGEMTSDVIVGLTLAMGAAGWMWQSSWSQSDAVFFGVRVRERFENSLEAIPISFSYSKNIKLFTAALILLYIAVRHLNDRVAQPNNYVLWALITTQAIGGRLAFWYARNQTLPFAAPQQSIHTVELSSLAPPSSAWQALYWPAVFLPFIIVTAAFFYVRHRWPVLPTAVDPIRFPLTVDSPPLTISWRSTLFALRLLITAALFNIDAILVAIAFNYYSRINEWGEDTPSRKSYRRQLMLFAVVSQWLMTVMFMFSFGSEITIAETSSVSLWHPILISALTLGGLAVIMVMLNSLYDNRPLGVVNQSPDVNWKLGLYYFNPHDSAGIIPTRFGIGHTLNLGHPLAWLIVVISLAGFIAQRTATVINASKQDPSVPSSIRFQFTSDTLALQRGEFAASERLLKLARDHYNHDLWSSIAFVLASNQVKPHSARKWAESAVYAAEWNSYRPPPVIFSGAASPTQELAALWSNLGFVCLNGKPQDLDCAQRYLLAASILDPRPAYAAQLTVAEQQDSTATLGEAQTRKSLINSFTGQPVGTAVFEVTLRSQLNRFRSPRPQKPTVTARWISGDSSLQSSTGALAQAIEFPWPDGGPATIQLRIQLKCEAASPCSAESLGPSASDH